MKAFIVYCHPSEDSFTSHVRDAFIKGLEDSGNEYIISDLYKMDFKSDMTEEEYLREGFYRDTPIVASDVLAEQEKINSSDAIVFIYPVFWTEAPAKLVGWFDRVWTYGFAYGNKTMKMLEKGLVLCVAGKPAEGLEEFGQLDSMKTVMLGDRLFNRVKQAEFFVIDGTSRKIELRNTRWDQNLKTAYEKGKNLFTPIEETGKPARIEACGTQEIETERLLLRQFNLDDVDSAFRNWAGVEEIQDSYGEPVYETPEKTEKLLRKYIIGYLSGYKYRWAVIEKESGECIGQIAFYHVETQNCWGEIEYCIGKAYQGKGYATEATKAVIDYGFKRIGFHKVQISCRPGNIQSKRVIEKCGFEYEGTLRDFFYRNGKYEGRMYFSLLADSNKRGGTVMDLYEAMNTRRSIRDFTEESIPEEIIKKILDAAYKAPSNDHFRDWHFIVVTDKEILREVLEGVPKNLTVKDVDAMDFISDPIQKESYQVAVPKQYRMLMDAAAVIIPLMKKKVDVMHPRNFSDLNCFATIWCSIENLWLAATAEGYGCNLRIPMGNEENIAKEVLGFPEEYLIPCFIGIGRPAENAVRTRQIEINIDEQIHWNKF